MANADAQDANADSDQKKDEAAVEETEAAPESDVLKINVEELDSWGVDDITNVGGSGEPLFANFTWEDWALLNLRFELHLLVHAFANDIGDAERQTFVESHLAYYYNLYYKREIRPEQFGAASFTEVLAF